MGIPGYTDVEELLQTEWHRLTRGRRLADGRPVLLKTSRPDVPRPTATDLLEREYDPNTLRSRMKKLGIRRGEANSHDIS